MEIGTKHTLHLILPRFRCSRATLSLFRIPLSKFLNKNSHNLGLNVSDQDHKTKIAIDFYLTFVIEIESDRVKNINKRYEKVI